MRLTKLRKAALRVVSMMQDLDESAQTSIIEGLIKGNKELIEEYAQAYDEGNS